MHRLLIVTISVLAGTVLSGCETMDKLDRMAIEHMEGPADPIVDEMTIDRPFDDVVATLSAMPVDEEKKEEDEKAKKAPDGYTKVDYVQLRPVGAWMPAPGAWEPGYLMLREDAEKFKMQPDKEHKTFSRNFAYDEGYPALKCKTACKITILIEKDTDLQTKTLVRYTGDGDVSVFAREMRQMIENLLNGKDIDAEPEKKSIQDSIKSMFKIDI